MRKQLIRSGLHRVLEATGLYSRLEWTPLHRVFVRFNNPSYEAAQRKERTFYRQFVTRGALVFDIGANNGSKAETFLRLGARVVAAEPDPKCVQVLRRRFVLSRHFHLVPAAIGGSAGQLELLLEKTGSAYNTLSAKWRDHSHKENAGSVMVKVVTADALISKWGIPDFVKIDVEGFEREVLCGLMTAVPAVSFEANLPLFLDETIECIDMLHTLDARYRFNACEQFSSSWFRHDWLTASKMKETIASPQWSNCEIFAFLRPPVPN